MQPNNRPTPVQEAFEQFIAQQSEAIQAAYARIHKDFIWRNFVDAISRIASAAKEEGLVDLWKLVDEYQRHQEQLAQASFEQLMARQSPELQEYYKQLKTEGHISWRSDNLLYDFGLNKAIHDNNLAFIKLIFTQYHWEKYYQLALDQMLLLAVRLDHWEIIQFFLKEFNWQKFRSPMRFMQDINEALGEIICCTDDDYGDQHPKENYFKAISFFINSFMHNPQMFGYNNASELMVDYCRTFGRAVGAVEILIAICSKFDTPAAKDFLQLLAGNLINLSCSQYELERKLQSLHKAIDDALAAVNQRIAVATYYKNVTEKQSSLRQQASAVDVAGNQKVAAIASIIERLEHMIFAQLVTTLPPHVTREQLLQQILVGHAAVLQDCLAHYSNSRQNFVTSQAKLEHIIAESKQTSKPQFIVLDHNCAAFNLDSRAILIIAPPRIANDPYQVWYFSPTGAAMPEVVQEIIQRQLGGVNISIIPNQAAAAQVAAQQKLGQ